MTLVRILVVLLLLLALVPADAATLEGVWVASQEETETLWLSMSMRSRRGGHSMSSRTVARGELAGLARSAVEAASVTPVSFEMRADAGTIAFRGQFAAGEGSGHFTFRPSAEFAREIGRQGLEPPTDRELFAMAVHGVDLRFLAELRKLGITELDKDDLVGMAIHGATAAFAAEMVALVGPLAADDLVAFRIHGVTPEFVRELRSLGLEGLEPDDYVALRIHGVTPAYLREMRALDVTGGHDELVRMRIHGIDAAFVRALRERGIDAVDPDLLVRVKIHWIDRILLGNHRRR